MCIRDRRNVKQRDFVVVLQLAGHQHPLLAVANLDAFFLQGEKHRGFADIETEGHIRNAFLLEDRLDFFCGLLEEADTGSDRATHARVSRQDVIFMKPGTVKPVMTCSRSEVPDPRIAVAGEEAVTDQLIARPLSDDRAGDVAMLY